MGKKRRKRGNGKEGREGGPYCTNMYFVDGVTRSGRGPARGVAERFGDDIELLGSDEFAELCRTRPQDFTRDRKLTPRVLVGSIVGKRGRSLGLDLRQLEREGLLETGVSAAAFSKARKKLNPEAIRRLARFHAAGVYRDGGYFVWHGMVLVGVDGSSADVDTNPETLDRWGNASNPGARPHAQAGISTAFDVLNRQIVDVSIGRCALDERGEVPGHVDVAREAVGDGVELCFVFDRGYPSVALAAELAEKGVHFVMRCPKTFLREEFEACEGAGGDITVDVALTRERLRGLADSGRTELLERLLALGSVRLRLVLVDIGGEEPERLVTDVGPERLTTEDLKEGYHLRWNSETCYRFEKEQLELENLSGRSVRSIEQDIYAKAYLLNLAFDLANEADLEFGRSGRQSGYKHVMTVNRSYAIGALRDDVVMMIACGDAGRRKELMGRIVGELQKHLVPVRPGRSRPKDGVTKRKGKGKGKKRRYNSRYKRT